jgi:hypothetical protein
MATQIYDIKYFELIDGTIIEATPLKIKYLREFMDRFELVKKAKNDDEAIGLLAYCALIAMKQYYPKINSISKLEDSIDLKNIYKVIDVAAGIKIKKDEKKEVSKQAEEGGLTWEKLDLLKLESELFLLGIWKDYQELELSLSMPELTTTLEAKRDLDYQEKKFFAAIQGVDLDKNSGQGTQNKWEEMKAKAFSGGKAKDPNDILALQGVNAQKAGFGIGMGLGYEDLTKKPKK